MGKIPPDQIEKLEALSKATNKPMKELVARIKEILATDPAIQTMEKEDFKIRYAVAGLYKEHATGGNDCYITLTRIPRLRDNNIKGVMTTVGEAYALVQKITRDDGGNTKVGEVKYGAGTFWRDGAKNIAKCIPGKVYKTSLKITDAKWGIEITSDRCTFTEVADHKMPTIQQFYDTEIKPKIRKIGIAEFDLNKSAYKTEIRIIEATVSDAQVGEKDGKEWGKYVIYDDTIMEKIGNITFWFDPKEINWMQGSLLVFGGHISERVDKKTSKALVEFNPHFVLPAGPNLAEPFKPIAKAKNKEEIDLDDIGDIPEKTTPKPASEEEIDFGV